MTQQRFTGRRVLVTGTAQGIGRRIAERFIEEGAEVKPPYGFFAGELFGVQRALQKLEEY